MSDDEDVNVRRLLPRSFHVMARVTGARVDELYELAEVINDHDNEAHCEDEPVRDGNLHFMVYVPVQDVDAGRGMVIAGDVATLAMEWACETCDIAYDWMLVADEQPLPYTAEEAEENAAMVADWAAIDALWPTLKPGDAVEVDMRFAVVVDVVGDTLRTCGSVQSLDPLVPALPGDSKIVTHHRLGLDQLPRRNPICRHGRDIRLYEGCNDCAFEAKCIIDGLYRRVVL